MDLATDRNTLGAYRRNSLVGNKRRRRVSSLSSVSITNATLVIAVLGLFCVANANHHLSTSTTYYHNDERSQPSPVRKYRDQWIYFPFSLDNRKRHLNEDDNQEKDEEEEQNSKEEQEAEQQDDDIANEADDDNNQNDDGNQKNNNGNGYNDDYFDDRLQDDFTGNRDDDDAYQEVDDFYAYVEDPGPPQLFPIRQRYLLGFLAASIALTLGATGGIGGGGIVVPVYIIIMGLPLKVAVPIGAITVFGGSLGSTFMNWKRRHPLADRPLIDWDLVLLMEPLTLAGTLAGTLFHRVFSERFLIVLLVLLLSATAHSTLSKAMRMYRAEIRYIRHLRSASHARPDSPNSSPSMMYTKTFSWDGVNSPVANVSSNARQPDQTEHHNMPTPRRLGQEEKERILIANPDFVTIRSELAEQEKFTPRGKIIAVISIFSVVVFLNVMVGGGAYESPWHIECGGLSFWVIHTVMLLFLIASAWAAQVYVVSRHEIKELVRFDYVHGDIKWDARSAILYPTVFTLAGFFAGTLGIGGGVITVPIMLTMGVHPAVVSATSSAMILFTSFASTSAYLIFGLILKDFATVGFGIGFFAALIGQTIMRQARQAKSASGRNFERNSYIAFAIGSIVLLSALLLTVQFTFNFLQEDDDYDGGLCDGLRF